MGVKLADFCFHQGFIQTVLPIFIETLKNAIYGWHQKYIQTALSNYMTC
jgi:hypothetical protein